uniref:Uncharacterized protein n=1 Tax=Anguilla anguilla TaxID=7936 RepID=A0A0E9VTP0_ANGAN
MAGETSTIAKQPALFRTKITLLSISQLNLTKRTLQLY